MFYQARTLPMTHIVFCFGRIIRTLQIIPSKIICKAPIKSLRDLIIRNVVALFYIFLNPIELSHHTFGEMKV